MVTREDLTPAQQAVQGMHAALCFAAQCDVPVAGSPLVFLAATDEDHLRYLGEILELSCADVAWFNEPDLDWSLTAVAASGGCVPRRLGGLPLALRGGETDDDNAETSR